MSALKEQSNSALRRALKEERDTSQSLRSEITAKEVALQEHLTQIDALKDEKHRLSLCLAQTREELKAERETQSANLTGGSVLNTLFSAADGTLPELNRLKQEKQLFAEELERRNSDLLHERREKTSLKELSDSEIARLERELAETKQELITLNEVVEAREAELSVSVGEHQELATQLKVQRKMAEDLGSKLRATAEQARQEKKLLGDKLDKLQARYKKKVPFDDMVDAELKSYHVIPSLVRSKRQWRSTSAALLCELKCLREATMRWRSKAGGAIAEKPASAASKVMLSLNALQIAVQAWFASEKTFGAGQQQSPAESFAKVKTRALNLVEAHKEFAEAMEDKEHFSKLHSRIEKAVLASIDEKASKDQRIVSLLSEVGESLCESKGDSLEGFEAIGEVVYRMAKTCHQHLLAMRDNKYAMSKLEMTVLDLSRRGRSKINASADIASAEKAADIELAAIQAKLHETEAKLSKLQATYTERCEAFTLNEKRLKSMERENERLARSQSEPLQQSGEETEDATKLGSSTYKEVTAEVVLPGEYPTEGEVVISQTVSSAAESGRHKEYNKESCAGLLQDMQKLKAALERTDARAIIMEEKYWSMVELVNNMKKDRKHHDEIISECKAEAERVKTTSRNELETTKSSYDVQLKKLTEHIMSLKQSLVEKERYAESLKNQMLSLHSDLN